MIDDFPSFRALPPELRLMIWSEALSVSSVCLALNDSAADGDLDNARCPPLTLAFVGPRPYLVGHACRESRRLMQEVFVKPLQGLGLTRDGRVYWVNLSSTVVHFGSSTTAVAAMGAFSVDELHRLRHIALGWCHFGSVARVCQRLATGCPDLRTIIIQIQGSRPDDATDQSHQHGPTPELAMFYTATLDSIGAEVSHGTLDTSYFRALLLEYFGETPPRIHFVSSRHENR